MCWGWPSGAVLASCRHPPAKSTAIPEVHPAAEDYRGNVNPIGPRACYDEGKRAAETLFMDYHRMNRVDIRIVRIFNTYGPRMHPFDGRVVSNFIRQALAGRDITIFGDGTQTRSFCYRDDLVEGLIRMMNTPDLVGPINLGNPVEFTIRQLAELVIELTGSRSKIVYEPLPADDPTRRRPDISLARTRLNWTPAVPLREGLQTDHRVVSLGESRAVPATDPELLTRAGRRTGPIRDFASGWGV